MRASDVYTSGTEMARTRGRGLVGWSAHVVDFVGEKKVQHLEVVCDDAEMDRAGLSWRGVSMSWRHHVQIPLVELTAHGEEAELHHPTRL